MRVLIALSFLVPSIAALADWKETYLGEAWAQSESHGIALAKKKVREWAVTKEEQCTEDEGIASLKIGMGYCYEGGAVPRFHCSVPGTFYCRIP